MNKQVYMDYSATTYTKPEVLEEMLPFFTENFGNPSSLYSFSDKTKKAVNLARERVSKALNAEKNEIFFTSGGSEADNWAIKGIAYANKKKGNHIITTKIEHHAILHTAQFLEKEGFKVTYLPVDEEGFVSVEDIKNAITDETILVSVMFANNEIGTIEPIKEIGELCKEKNIYFHTDAVQAIGHVDIDVKDMNIDLLSMSAHKFYGPKGVGALYIKNGVKIQNLIHGGGQERGKRASTENTAGIVGLGKAIELAMENMPEENEKLSNLRGRLIRGIEARIPEVKLNGPKDMSRRLPNNVNFSFIGIEGETLLLDLDMNGIFGSTGSACASASLDPSHVLLSIGLPHETAHGSLRLSLGAKNTEEDIDYVLEVLPKIIKQRREMSPLWEDYMKNKEEK
ncbi:cysteine desulfurase IscS [Clostridium botulinum]|uniref:Cysteine desulfurase IscS n=2 Tax=Clostridium botulinum A TaxID=36826 RepID=ISCS_CLOBH|nr:cysteine desulfurase NifS [Clostridium botulinum]A5I4Z9.1 RecName: Full=Cysteine desulfurase IscS [Clostridium botulinum A str. Hall]A7FWJ9.1 RecName: Full=Cysteine desulfurase IscS [Clostridium botulinum A str. ATCC 19397]ABS34137.1 cysteine desulfurase NifS [Clostridium botulinum A str. ATCC 19397]ABS37989.1 cysteine desulfurase NifS [Clostridium botulinum A str. Hall]APQ72543.1 cysteine desulfurase NifS [Clostridium botulinum]APQ95854.1 cysteine desulfurase NifS [Clostridium botulinum]